MMRLHVLHRDIIPAEDQAVPAHQIFPASQLPEAAELPGESTDPVGGTVLPVVVSLDSGLELLNPMTAGLGLPVVHPETPIRALAIDPEELKTATRDTLVRFRFAELEAARYRRDPKSLQEVVKRLDLDQVLAGTIAYRWLGRTDPHLRPSEITELIGPHVHKDTIRKIRVSLQKQGISPSPRPETPEKSDSSPSSPTSDPTTIGPGNPYPNAKAVAQGDKYPQAEKAFAQGSPGTALEGYELMTVLRMVEEVWTTTRIYKQRIPAAEALVRALIKYEDPSEAIIKFCAEMEQDHGIQF